MMNIITEILTNGYMVAGIAASVAACAGIAAYPALRESYENSREKKAREAEERERRCILREEARRNQRLYDPDVMMGYDSYKKRSNNNAKRFGVIAIVVGMAIMNISFLTVLADSGSTAYTEYSEPEYMSDWNEYDDYEYTEYDNGYWDYSPYYSFNDGYSEAQAVEYDY